MIVNIIFIFIIIMYWSYDIYSYWCYYNNVNLFA